MTFVCYETPVTHQDPPERREVHYEGSVQGVGFRYTALHIAGGCDVSGYIRNLSDGRVQVVAEGSPAQLAEFLATVSRAMEANINHTDVVKSPATGEFAGFQMRF